MSSTLPGGCGERGRSSNSVQAIIIMQETCMDLSFVEHFLLQFSEIKILLIYKRIASSLVIGKLQKVYQFLTDKLQKFIRSGLFQLLSKKFQSRWHCSLSSSHSPRSLGSSFKNLSNISHLFVCLFSFLFTL